MMITEKHRELIGDAVTLARSKYSRVSAIEYDAAAEESCGARQLICQLADAEGEETSVRCAAAISSSTEWRTLIGELLRYSVPSARAIRVMSRAVEAHVATHPLAKIADFPIIEVFPAFDAMTENGVIRTTNRFTRNPADFDRLLLIGVAAPLDETTVCQLSSFDSDTVFLVAEEPDCVVDGDRYLLKPALLVGCAL